MLGNVGATGAGAGATRFTEGDGAARPSGSRDGPAAHPGPRRLELQARCPRSAGPRRPLRSLSWARLAAVATLAALSPAPHTSFAGVHLGPALGRPVCREALREPVQVRASGGAGTRPGEDWKAWPFPLVPRLQEQPGAPSGLRGKLGPAAGRGAEPRPWGSSLPRDLGSPGLPGRGRGHPQSAVQSRPPPASSRGCPCRSRSAPSCRASWLSRASESPAGETEFKGKTNEMLIC